MTEAVNLEFSFPFAMNWVEGNRKIPALIEDDKKVSGFFVIIVVWASSPRPPQVQLETDLIICWRTPWFDQENCE